MVHSCERFLSVFRTLCFILQIPYGFRIVFWLVFRIEWVLDVYIKDLWTAKFAGVKFNPQWRKLTNAIVAVGKMNFDQKIPSELPRRCSVQLAPSTVPGRVFHLLSFCSNNAQRQPISRPSGRVLRPENNHHIPYNCSQAVWQRYGTPVITLLLVYCEPNRTWTNMDFQPWSPYACTDPPNRWP